MTTAGVWEVIAAGRFWFRGKNSDRWDEASCLAVSFHDRLKLTIAFYSVNLALTENEGLGCDYELENAPVGRH